MAVYLMLRNFAKNCNLIEALQDNSRLQKSLGFPLWGPGVSLQNFMASITAIAKILQSPTYLQREKHPQSQATSVAQHTGVFH